MQYMGPCRSKLRRAERRYQSHKHESRKWELRRRLFTRYGFEPDAVSDPCCVLSELDQVASELATADWFGAARLPELFEMAVLAQLEADNGRLD